MNLLYKTKFWNKIESAREELEGSYYYDNETDTEYNFPKKDPIVYANAYKYCYTTMGIFFNIVDTIEEIKLIKTQIQHSQDFALQNKEFTTDFILSFSYKNWIIRINIITEQIILLLNHVFRLKLPNQDLINKIFQHKKVKENKVLYLSILNFVDFLYEKILLKVNTQSFKKARNEIVHQANFSHDTISHLSSILFLYKMGAFENKESEDLYLEEGIASEKIKNEILNFSTLFFEKISPLYTLFAQEFPKNFQALIKK